MILFKTNHKIVCPNNIQEYHWFNIGYCCSIIILFMYLTSDTLHVQCVYKSIGQSCSGCGITTTFKNIIKGNYYLLSTSFGQLFLFLIGQMLLRILSSILIRQSNYYSLVLYVDLVLSFTWFSYAFSSFFT